ncbi:pectate lyase-like [Lycium barbarum]|uniref:pectate lyase-like n=1 Tax=Lycium barbarum TaxID=112863 RepID=UPI00293EE7CC|nr:pectate lyase-like [Lycium barbarum]
MASVSCNSVIFYFSLLFFASLIPKLHANIADFDPYLEKKAEEAIKSSLAAYNENPEQLTETFNKEVGETILNGTRRYLREMI